MVNQAQRDAQREFAQRIGRNLIRARKVAGFSQEELSFEAGLHRTEVGMLERGVRIPKLDTAVKLVGALGISLDELAKGIEWRAAVRAGSWVVAARDETSPAA